VTRHADDSAEIERVVAALGLSADGTGAVLELKARRGLRTRCCRGADRARMRSAAPKTARGA